VPLTLFDSVVALADAYLQLTVPSFEFPRDIPPTVAFGTPPIIPNQAPLSPWANDLDGSRKVVLVTQGTVANHDLGLLVTNGGYGSVNQAMSAGIPLVTAGLTEDKADVNRVRADHAQYHGADDGAAARGGWHRRRGDGLQPDGDRRRGQWTGRRPP
jgi:UDP:flavonoid glycosyltransferase YjiC (YdhE family)